jgi:tetratricopeptide (TPR) repeat protein
LQALRYKSCRNTLKQYQIAISLLKKKMGLEYRMHQLDPSRQDLEGEGCSLAEEGDFKSAIQCFEKAVAEERGQNNAHTYEMVAQCMMEIGSNEEAVDAASKATDCEPEVWEKHPWWLSELLSPHFDDFMKHIILAAVGRRFPHPCQSSEKQ